MNSFIDIAKAALIYTIPLSIASFFFGMIIAVFVASGRIYLNIVVKTLFRIYCALIRGTPLLIQLFIIFYALPRIGIVLDPIPSAIIGLSLHVGAYASEIIRSALLNVPQSIKEAGLAMGFTRYQVFWHVMVPYAAYTSVAPLFNTFIDIIKATSLTSIILVPEMMRKAQEYAIQSSQFLIVYSQAALIYLCICLILEYAQKQLEEKVRIEKSS